MSRDGSFARGGFREIFNRKLKTAPDFAPRGTRGLVAYFGPAIDDPAVARRASQWAHANFKVLVFAFRRNILPRHVEEHFVDLGRLIPRSRLGRIAPLVRGAWRIFRHRKALASASVFIGRNPDNALLAWFARRVCGARVPFIYEILDVNSSCARPGLRGAALRRIEKWILRRTALLVVSSPLFIENYYAKLLDYKGEWFLFENKVPRFVHASQPRQRMLGDQPGARRVSVGLKPPRWRIGWFGYLDDTGSWRILRHLAESLRDKVEIYVRGVPNAGFDMSEFLADVARFENVTYGGPYQNPEDLADIYDSIDLVWSVDCIAPEGNSRWLLTNALYEAGYFGKPVLGIAGNAVGHFAESRSIGWCIKEPILDNLIEFIDQLTLDAYDAKCRCIESARDELFSETDEIDRLWSAVIGFRQSGPVFFGREHHAGPQLASPAGIERKLLFIGLFPPPVDGQRLMTQSAYERICKRVPGVVRYDIDRTSPWLNHQFSKLISAATAALRLIWERAKGYSALYLAPHSGGLLLLSCLIALVARACGYVLAAHYHSYLNMSRRSPLMAAFIAICGPRTLHIVLAPPMAHDLQRFYPGVRRVMVLSNCGFIEPHPPIERRLNARRLRIGHLSNLSIEKGLGAVLDCMRALRRQGVGVELWLAGPPESPESEQIVKSAQSEFGESLVYFGRLAPFEVRRFYRSIDIFLFPTAYRHEAEPLVIVDAIASGVPVIATDRGCIDYLLHSSGGWAIPLEDFVAKASEQIARWANAPDQLAEASRLSRARFLQLHTESALRFDEVLESLVGDAPKPDQGSLAAG